MTESLKRAEPQSSEEHFRLLVSGVREYAIYMLDPAGRILTWNPGAARLKGYTESEILGQSFARFFTAEDQQERVPERILTVARKLGSHRQEGWRIRKDGTRFWADVLVTALYGAPGELKGYSKVTRDETDKHHMQEALRASEERFRLLVGGLKEHALYMLDPTGQIASWNDGAQRIKQYTASEVIGRNFSIFFTPDDRAAGKPQRELEVASKLGAYEEEGWRLRKDGTRFWASVVVTALRDEAGGIKGYAKITRDESKRHQASIELQSALERATEAETRLRAHAQDLEERVGERTRLLSEQKDALRVMNAELEQFAYVASHDLQEPLRMIGLHLDLLKRRNAGRLDEHSDASIDKAATAAERMRTMIKSLLSYSRIDHEPKSFDPTDANRAFADAVQNLRATIDQRGATVVAKPLPNLPIGQTQLMQVFQNLIANGIKYNRCAAPQIDISAARDGDDWVVTVSDNGIGIEEAHLDHIFEPFRRLHAHHEFAGTGVGLAIVKKIVERHAGRVSVRSVVNQGSSFSFSLRAA